MKTDFRFIGDNTRIRCGELVIYGIRKANEPFQKGEIISINMDAPGIKTEEDYNVLVRMMENNGNFQRIKKKNKESKKDRKMKEE